MSVNATESQTGEVVVQDGDMTEHYLSKTQVAKKLGITLGALNTLKLPKPDATIGHRAGWLDETIEKWDAQRPGRGRAWEKDPSEDD